MKSFRTILVYCLVGFILSLTSLVSSAIAVESIVDKQGRPNNSAAIRNNIVDTFSCEGKDYGSYANMSNDCRLFHICYPVILADGTMQTQKQSFICPQETIFNQETHTCTFPADSSSCPKPAASI